LEFTVFDTGIGIPPEKLETIFDDFTQADASLTRKYGGTGLGLGISRRLVEAMGGAITASSRPGCGSTFRFSVQFEPAPEDTGRVRVALGDSQTKRVLLIDDNATGGLILQGTLKTWGLESDAFQHLEQGGRANSRMRSPFYRLAFGPALTALGRRPKPGVSPRGCPSYCWFPKPRERMRRTGKRLDYLAMPSSL
jgi:hypothetical protein